jgi:hypothetical protein
MGEPLFGFWPSAGDSEASFMTRGLALLDLGTGTEAILTQVSDLFTALAVLGVGNYQLTINPAAGMTDPNRAIVFAQPYDLGSARTVTVEVEAAVAKIRIRSFLANGTANPVNRVALALYYAHP